VLVERKRPGARKALTRGFRHVSWHTHPDGVIVAQVNKPEVCDRLDLGVAPRIDFVSINRKIANKTVAAITQNRLEETDLECFAQITNAETSHGRQDTIPRLILASPTLEVHSRRRRRPARDADELSRRSVGLREIGFDGLLRLRLCD
jgi:hypothetical protein